jgi:hypothetical protein
MPRTSRAEQGAELDGQIAQIQKEMARLVQLVGDVETVVDMFGWRPQNGRELMLSIFSACRSVDVAS